MQDTRTYDIAILIINSRKVFIPDTVQETKLKLFPCEKGTVR